MPVIGTEQFVSSGSSKALTIPAEAHAIMILGSSQSGAAENDPISLGGVAVSAEWPATDDSGDRSVIWFIGDITARSNDTLTFDGGTAVDYTVLYIDSTVAAHGTPGDTTLHPPGTYTHSYGEAPNGGRVIVGVVAHSHTLFSANLSFGSGITQVFGPVTADSYIRIQGYRVGDLVDSVSVSVISTGGNPNNTLRRIVSRAVYETEGAVAPTPDPPTGRRVPSPRLYVELFDNDTSDFGPEDCAGLVYDARKVGWAQWSRFPPQAFFTLRKSSVYNDRIVAGLSHVRIWYVDEARDYGPVLVFNGRIGDASESRDDVVWQCHGYLAELALSRTGYRVMYQGKKIAAAVRKEINKDATKGKFVNYGARRQTFSLFEHVGLGTIQNPLNGSGKAVKLESGFGVIDVPRLLFLFDLTEIGRANTTQNVVMEVSRSITPEFNFWRDKGSQLSFISLRLPGNIRDYQFMRGVANVRNDLASIGTRKGQAREIKHSVADGTYGYEDFGRRQDTFAIRTLAGFRNLDDEAGRFSAQKMIVKRAVREATRPTRELSIDIPVERMMPFDGWDIEDEIPVEIDDGRTQIDQLYRIVGAQGVMDGSGYRQRLYVVTDP